MKKMKTIGMALCALIVVVLVAGCGGGGSSAGDFAGTYRGSYAFQNPSGVGGTFLLNVGESGAAEAVFDEDRSAELRVSGRVDGSGRINIVDDESGPNGQVVAIAINGRIDRSQGNANGQIRLSGTEITTDFTGTFSATRTSGNRVLQKEQSADAAQGKAQKSLHDLLRGS